MERYLIAAVLGVLFLLVWPTLPPLHYLIAGWVLVGVFTLRWRRFDVLLICLTTTTWAVYCAQHYQSSLPPSTLENQAFKVQLRIEGLSEKNAYGLRFRATPLKILSRIDYQLPARSQWQLTSQHTLDLRPQQIWQMTVTLRRPHGVASAGAFDYQAWLLSEGITATGKVGRAKLIQPADWSVDEWRLHIREKFVANFAQQENAGVVLALLTGDRVLVSDKAWELYAATGISHLMAISGAHVMLAAFAVTHIMVWLLKCYPSLFLRVPLAQIKLPLMLLVAVAYGFLAGLSLPTLRTLLMVSLALCLTGLRQEVPVTRILLLALTLLLLWQPLSVHSIGLWLSFTAVALLLLWSGMMRQEHKVKRFVRVQLWLSVALVPITLAFFGKLSLVAPLANFLAIPVVSLCIVPLALLGLLSDVIEPIQNLCWQLAIYAVNGLNGYLGVLANMPYAQQSWLLSPVALWFLSLVLLMWLLPKGVLPRLLTPLFVLAIVCRWPMLAKGEVQLSIIDVGQGLSVLVQTKHHALLYDTGANANAGERIINPYLAWLQLRRLDTLMISHNDKDHTGGADALLAQFTPKQVMYSASPEGYQLAPSIPQRLCYAGQQWHWDEVHFQVLSPIVGVNYDKDNNRSCVLRVSGQGFSVLLTGDIEAPAEKILVKQATHLQSDILVLGHHGSKTSSTPEFLAQVKAQLAIVSAGYRNQFNHPSPPVIQRLIQSQTVIDNTIDHGTLRYHLTKQGIISREAWRQRGHYWLNAP